MATDAAVDGAAAQPGVQSEAAGNVSAEPERPSPAASGPSKGIEKLREMIKNPSAFRKVPAEKAVATPSALSLFREPTLNIGTLPSMSKTDRRWPAEIEERSMVEKRKATDLNLKTVIIDPYSDLTIIVGTPDSTDGQVAFRISKSSLRHASEVWTRMLTGAWGANRKNQYEIEFPDDSPWAFEQVLRIAHLQVNKLPSKMDLAQLRSLATLTDIYDLLRVVQIPTKFKDWLVPGQAIQQPWPAQPSLQDWAFIAHTFQSPSDYSYLINRLAMEVQVDKTDASFYHVTGDQKTKLREELPDRMLIDIRSIRALILGEWIKLCNTAFDKAVLQISEEPPDLCNKAICRATRVGIMSSGLQTAGFYPFTGSTQTMYESVAWYWKALNNVGAGFKTYKPCDGAYGYGYGNHRSSCSYEKCLGDLGFLTEARATLEQKGHKDVVPHLLSVSPHVIVPEHG